MALLVAVLGSTVYIRRSTKLDDLAGLRSMYQQSRPTETRISEFGYAPLPLVRGALGLGENNRLRCIENNLIGATEKTPNAQTLHALGVFYLTQQKYSDAIREFESALKLANNNAKIYNDLGVTHFETSKAAAKETRLQELAQSLEELTKATELDSNLLEALFNKSLVLGELGLPREAKESWTLYLQKDPSSPWTVEARKYLERLENEQALFKTDEKVLSGFLTAYHNHDVSILLRGNAEKLKLRGGLLCFAQREFSF